MAEIGAQSNNSNVLKGGTEEWVPGGERASFAEWTSAENKDTGKSAYGRMGQI